MIELKEIVQYDETTSIWHKDNPVRSLIWFIVLLTGAPLAVSGVAGWGAVNAFIGASSTRIFTAPNRASI